LLIFGAILSIAAVVALQPVYFAAMANLDRVISQEAMRGHFRDAFKIGVLSDEAHPSNHLFTSGDCFTDCRPPDRPRRAEELLTTTCSCERPGQARQWRGGLSCLKFQSVGGWSEAKPGPFAFPPVGR
jgi:hypothetical protein